MLPETSALILCGSERCLRMLPCPVRTRLHNRGSRQIVTGLYCCLQAKEDASMYRRELELAKGRRSGLFSKWAPSKKPSAYAPADSCPSGARPSESIHSSGSPEADVDSIFSLPSVKHTASP